MKKMKSLFRQQFTQAALLVLLCLLLLAAGFGGLLYNFLVKQTRREVLSAANSTRELAAAYASTGELGGDWGMRMSMTFFAEVTGTHLMIADSAGEVFLCSDRNFQCLHVGLSVPSGLLPADPARSYTGISTLGGLYSDSRYAAILPVANAFGGVAGYVVATSDMSEALSLMSRVLLLFVLSAAAVIIIALVVSSATARRQVRPLREMADASRKFAYGDFGARVDEESNIIEIRELAGSFNAMAASMAEAEMRRRDFVDSVSHDLKTPITTISGYVDGILDGAIPPERTEDCLKTISSEAKRLGRIVRSFLELSRLQSKLAEIQGAELLVMDEFEIDEVMRQVLISCEGRIEAKNLDVDVELPDDPVPVLGMRDSIMQVVYNLVDNAIKFSAPNSTLSLKLRTEGRKAYVTVSDYGKTIPPEEQSMIFERFHKADFSRSENKEGVGLGLYIVKSILNIHNEDITVKSERGQTEFTFTLTLAKK